MDKARHEPGRAAKLNSSVLAPYCCRRCGRGTVLAYGHEHPKNRICIRCLDNIEVRLRFVLTSSRNDPAGQARRLSVYNWIMALSSNQHERSSCQHQTIHPS